MDMEASYSRNELWESAGVAGLALGFVSIAYLALGQLLSIGTPSVALSVLISILSFILWAGKLVLCIFLMKYFMKKFCSAHPGCINQDSFKFGVCTALLSALIYSAAYFAFVSFISPESIKESFDAAMSSYSSMMDSNSIAAIESMEENFPMIAFFSNLIYCFLFGTILSAILSRNIPSRDPFAEDRQ